MSFLLAPLQKTYQHYDSMILISNVNGAHGKTHIVWPWRKWEWVCKYFVLSNPNSNTSSLLASKRFLWYVYKKSLNIFKNVDKNWTSNIFYYSIIFSWLKNYFGCKFWRKEWKWYEFKIIVHVYIQINVFIF